MNRRGGQWPDQAGEQRRSGRWASAGWGVRNPGHPPKAGGDFGDTRSRIRGGFQSPIPSVGSLLRRSTSISLSRSTLSSSCRRVRSTTCRHRHAVGTETPASSSHSRTVLPSKTHSMQRANQLQGFLMWARGVPVKSSKERVHALQR